VLVGTYGPYVQLGEVSDDNKKPKRSSLPKGMKPEDLTLDIAVGLLSLPRNLGTHPETGAKIQTNLGRFGPYVVHDQGKEGKDYRSLKAEDNVLTISLDRALALLAEPKRGRGRGTKAALKELGAHPTDQEPINIFDGPYGPYVKHGKVNASLPEGETVETLTLEKAIALLADKEGTQKTTRKKAATGTKTTAKKTATKSTTAKKTATKSTTAKKTTTRKASTKTPES
jgi:DNA topoisomerase-1